MDPIHVLLVEDNEGDIILIKETWESAKVFINLSVVKDGKEALDFLTRQGKYPNTTRPDIILLDINLPKKNGYEVLQIIKATESLRQIPVIMLTTSSYAPDVNRAYKNYANCYIEKPVEADTFLKAISKIGNFGISIVKLPGK